MAKRRGGGGGGSSMGLIMTLVFFILTTITLGVTTYMGYAEQTDLKEKAKTADGKVKEAKEEKEYYKFQALVVREYVGYPFKDEKDNDNFRTLLANDKAQFSTAGKVTNRFGDKMTDAKEFKELVETLDKAAPWKAPGELSPPTTYVNLIATRDNDLKKANDKIIELNQQIQDLQGEQTQLKAKLKEENTIFTVAIKAAKDKAEENRKSDRTDIARLTALLDDTSKEKAKSDKARGDKEVAFKDLDEKNKKTEADLKKETKDKNEVEAKLNQVDSENRDLRKKVPDEKKTASDKGLPPLAIPILERWPQDKMKWQIIRLDQKGTQPYINLGSGDGLEPQVTFYVHAMGRDGKLSPTPKGTVEVIQLIPNSPHLARVRVTSVVDPNKDPIVVGDRLFNPIWGPGQPKRVAIAGLADVGGEGTDNSADLRRILARSNVVVDAYVDTRNDKEPEILNGRGDKGAVTSKTNFLIVGDDLEQVARHRKKDDKEYKAKFTALMNELREKATANGIKVIQVSEYLEMIGHRPPKVTTTR